MAIICALFLWSCSESDSNSAAPKKDTSPPTISLAVSVTLVMADGSVDLTATVSDNEGVTEVEFYDGASQLTTDTTSAFAHTVSYTETDNGINKPCAIAKDAAGNSTASVTLSVIVAINMLVGSFALGAEPPDWTAFTVEFVASGFTHTIGFWGEWADDSSYKLDNVAVVLKS